MSRDPRTSPSGQHTFSACLLPPRAGWWADDVLEWVAHMGLPLWRFKASGSLARRGFGDQGGGNICCRHGLQWEVQGAVPLAGVLKTGMAVAVQEVGAAAGVLEMWRYCSLADCMQWCTIPRSIDWGTRDDGEIWDFCRRNQDKWIKDDEFACENVEFKVEIPSLELRPAQENTLMNTNF